MNLLLTSARRLHLNSSFAFESPLVNRTTPTFGPGLKSRASSSGSGTSGPKFLFDGDEIIPRVFLGAACNDLNEFRSRGITHVVSVSEEWPPRYVRDIHYLFAPVPVFFRKNIISVFPVCAQYISDVLKSDDKSKVYVHCSAGVARSATVICAYLMAAYPSKFDSPAAAVKFVKDIRSRINPSESYMMQLEEWKAANYDETSEIFADSIRRHGEAVPKFQLFSPPGSAFKTRVSNHKKVTIFNFDELE